VQEQNLKNYILKTIRNGRSEPFLKRKKFLIVTQ